VGDNLLDLWIVFLQGSQSNHCDLSYPQIQNTTPTTENRCKVINQLSNTIDYFDKKLDKNYSVSQSHEVRSLKLFVPCSLFPVPQNDNFVSHQYENCYI
jgi:hypothetical protein